jgi:hypothetical protein
MSQSALAHMAHANLIQQEISAEILPHSETQTALEKLRLADARLREIRTLIDRTLPELRSRSLSPHDVTPDQLLNLRKNIQYQTAAVNLTKASLFPPDDRLNRSDVLNLVLNQLDEVLRNTSDDELLWWQVQLDRVEALRLAGKLEQAEQALQALPETKRPVETQTAILEEQLRLALASNSLRPASALVEPALGLNPSTPELQLALLELMMRLSAEDPAATQANWTSRASKLTRQIERDHGAYWGRRAELVLIGPATNGNDSRPIAANDLEILTRVGDAAMRKGNFADAVKAYDRASQFATSSKLPGQAFLLSVLAAQAVEKQGLPVDASARLIAAAKNWPDQIDAPAAHLRGCWDLAQAAQNDRQLGSQLTGHLNEHLRLWPQSKVIDKARLWLANQYVFDKQWSAALDAYLAIDWENDAAATAARQLGPVARSIIDELKAQNQPWKPTSLQLVERINEKLTAPNGDGPAKWTQARLYTLTSLAEFGFATQSVEPSLVSALIQPALNESGDAFPDWSKRARAWHVVSTAMQPQSIDAAESMLKALPNEAELMRICVDALEQPANESRRRELAPIILLACDKGLTDPAAKDAHLFRFAKATSLKSLGRLDEAIAELESLAGEFANTLKVQLELARVLTEQGRDRNKALEKWRALAIRVKSGSDAWFESKYQIASLLRDLGKTDEATQLLKYIKAVPPGWSDSRWRDDFEKLLTDLTR